MIRLSADLSRTSRLGEVLPPTAALSPPAPRFTAPRRGGGAAADLLVDWGPLRLVVELKPSGATAPVSQAITRVKDAAARLGARTIPVVAVPYMGETGRRLCAEAGVSWLDLSGNARLTAPGLRIHVEGRPSLFARRGRPSTPFAPRGARVARHLLLDPARPLRQQQLARETGLDPGSVSRTVARLEALELVTRLPGGAVQVRDPNLLLDAWAEEYDLEKHQILRGHVSARTSEELLERLAHAPWPVGVRHAATGLGAAWLYTRFAGFRLVTWLSEQPPAVDLLRELGFRDEPRGANVWLVVPNDSGVFDGMSRVDEIPVVHPVQAYLDLLQHPERAKEAAAELRTRMLAWSA